MAIEKVIDIKVQGNGEQAIGSLRSQLKQAQAEVAVLSDKFGVTSVEAAAAARKAAELKDRIADAKSLTDAFNPDAKFKALSSSLSGVAGGFAAVQGGMSLFGAESADVQKTLLKVQSAMALSQGLQSVGESIDSFKQLGSVVKNTAVVQGLYNFVQTGSLTLTKANTIATEAQAVATEGSAFATATATTGLKLFRLALIGTGIGALVVGVGLLIANFDQVKKVVLNLIPGLAQVGKFIGGIVDSVTDFVGATSDATRALDKLKKDADNTLSVNKKFMKEHGDQVDEYTKKKIEAKNSYAEAIKEDGADQVALAKRLNRELGDIEYSRGDEKRKKQKEANEKAAADRKTESERVKKEAEDEAKRAKEEKEKNTIQEAETFRNQLEGVKKIEADARKANADALLTDQQKAINAENEAYQTKINNALKFGESTEEVTKEHLRKLKEIEDNKRLKDDEQKVTDLEKIATDSTATFEARLAAVDAEQALFQKQLDDKVISEEEYNRKVKGLSKSREDIDKAEKAAKAANLKAVGDLLGNLSNLLGESTAAGKAAAVAQATISTFQSAQSAYASLSGIPIVGPALGAVAAGVAVASGIANVNKILSVQVPGGGGGGSSPSPAAVPSPPSFNTVGSSSTNQIAQTLGQQSQTPIKSYVVASDVSSAQALDRNIISNASIG